MDKKNYFALAIIALLLGGGLLVYLVNQMPVTQQAPSMMKPSQNSQVGRNQASTEPALSAEEVAAANREAIDNRDNSGCGSIQDDQERTNCRNNVTITKASDAKDANLCNTITDEVWRNSCTDSVILVTARDEGRPAICDQMQEKARVAECKKLASQ